jgi:hypothetical protein
MGQPPEKIAKIKQQGRAGFARLWKRKSGSDAPQARFGRCLLAEDISDHIGGWKTIVCRWHDPTGIQGDGEHSHLERRHYGELRACRRSPNRKSVNLRRIAGVTLSGAEGGARSRNPERSWRRNSVVSGT